MELDDGSSSSGSSKLLATFLRKRKQFNKEFFITTDDRLSTNI